MFEYQTAISELTGLPVSNASVYEGPSAVAAAGYLAKLQPAGAHALPRQPRRAPAQPRDARHHERRLGDDDRGDPARRRRDRRRRARARRSATTSPPSSCSTRTSSARSRTSRRSCPPPRRPARSSIVQCDPIPLGILRPPGDFGVDVAVGEGQTLGNRLDFGGPSFGFFAAQRGLPAPHARPDRRRDDRRRRPPRLRAHAADARAAHPAREGDAQHLHGPGAQRARGRDLPELARPRRASSSSASCCSSAPPTRATRWPRSRASSRCTSSRSCASSPSRSTPTSTR